MQLGENYKQNGWRQVHGKKVTAVLLGDNCETIILW
jgi:hypothetical protein